MVVQWCLCRGKALLPAGKYFGNTLYFWPILSSYTTSTVRCINFKNDSLMKYTFRTSLPSAVPVKLEKIVRNRYSWTSETNKLNREDKKKLAIKEREERRLMIEEEGRKIERIFESTTHLSTSEWRDVIDQCTEWRRNDRKSTDPKATDYCIMQFCYQYRNYSLATSYIDHRRNEGCEPSVVVLGKYLSLCAGTIEECGEDKILDLYCEITSKQKVLDYHLTDSVIKGLTKTREWEQSLKYIPFLNHRYEGFTSYYNHIIDAAFRHGDYDTGWRYFDVMCAKEVVPDAFVFEQLRRQCRAIEHNLAEKFAVTALKKLHRYELVVKPDVADQLAMMFKKDLGWNATHVKIGYKGICPACQHQLGGLNVSEEEFKQLQEAFKSDVLIGSDVFLKSSPTEIHRFFEFVERHTPFSVVIDGLNLMYQHSTNKNFTEVSKVLGQLIKKDPHCRGLVIGRQHSIHYYRKLDGVAGSNFKFFFVKDNSKDDGFMIYAGLRSGIGTKILTRDMLRENVYYLKDSKMKSAFRRWLRMHQMVIGNYPYRNLQDPVKFNIQAQSTEDGAWHVPYYCEKNSIHANPDSWLCLRPSTQKDDRFNGK